MEISVLLVGWGWTYDQLKSGWQEIEALDYEWGQMASRKR
jgi:hypothetical protein